MNQADPSVSLDQPAILRRLLSHLLGRGGYVRYATTVGRLPRNFHRGLRDPQSNSNRIVELNCALWLQALDYDLCPSALLALVPQRHAAQATSLTLHDALMDLLGERAFHHLAWRVSRSQIAVIGAAANPQSIAHPHLQIAVVTMGALRAKGLRPLDAIDYFVDLNESGAFVLYRSTHRRRTTRLEA